MLSFKISKFRISDLCALFWVGKGGQCFTNCAVCAVKMIVAKLFPGVAILDGHSQPIRAVTVSCVKAFLQGADVWQVMAQLLDAFNDNGR